MIVAPLHVNAPIDGQKITNLICTGYGRVVLGCCDGTIQEFIFEPRVFNIIMYSFIVLFLEFYWYYCLRIHS